MRWVGMKGAGVGGGPLILLGIDGGVTRDNIAEYGQMLFDDRKIVISSAIEDAEEYAATLRHEMLHAALHIAGISYLKKY